MKLCVLQTECDRRCLRKRRVLRLFLGFLCVFFLACRCAAADGALVGTLSAPLNAFSGRTLDTFARSTADETPLGNAAADAAMTACRTEFAVIAGGNLTASLEAGPVTKENVSAAVADRMLYTAEVSPAELKALLEECLARIVMGEDEYIDRDASEYACYPQIAGFRLKYDASAPVGERVMSIRPEGEQELNLEETEKTMRLCIDDALLPWVQEAEDSGIRLPEALSSMLREGLGTDYARENRVLEYGVNNNSLYSRVPFGLVFVLIAVFVLANGSRFKKNVDFNR